MPVTLTLTDDQALDIVSQVSSLLSRKQLPFSNDTEKSQGFLVKKQRRNKDQKPMVELVKCYVDKLNNGAEFHHREVHHAIGQNKITSASISYALGVLKAKKKISMLQRGTYKVL